MKSRSIFALCFAAASAIAVTLAATDVQAQSAPAASSDGIATIVAMRQQSLVGTHDFIDRRAAFEKLMAGFPVPDDVTIRTVSANGVSGKWISPDKGTSSSARPRGVILYLHGGGFYSGSSDSHRVLAATLAKDAQANVLLIDYRRMPEAVYPAQIDDAVASYEWLLQQGYSASHIALAGESAGGNLVVELALRLRAAHRPLPTSIVAMSPIMDLTASGESSQTNAARDPLLTHAAPARRPWSPTCADCRLCFCKSAQAKSCSTTACGWHKRPLRTTSQSRLKFGPGWSTSGSCFRASYPMPAVRSSTLVTSSIHTWHALKTCHDRRHD
jgi:acetyl esterase/lipase